MKLLIFEKIVSLIPLLSCLFSLVSSVTDTITQSQSITDPGSITSASNIFKLGFFSPNGTTDRYVGIWYSAVPVLNVIWVANRENPIKDNFGVVKISENGNLLILDGQNITVFSSNSSTNSSGNLSSISGQILDSGNFVLLSDNSGKYLWQSFENPTNSFLSKMKLGSISTAGERKILTSWKSPLDPSIGSFYAALDRTRLPEFFILNNSKPYWRTGPWNNQVFIGVPYMTNVPYMNSVYNDGFNMGKEDDGSNYLTLSLAIKSDLPTFQLNSQGILKQIRWNSETASWETLFVSQESECDVYGKCGAFGSCYNAKITIMCSCLKGFEPKNVEEWSRGIWTHGCVRTTNLQCLRIQENITSSEDQAKQDGFIQLVNMKVPDFAEWSPTIGDKCRAQCFSNCSCVAYSLVNGIGCMWWDRDLIDIQKFSNAGADLYVRVAYYSDLDKKRDMKVIIAITVIAGTISLILFTYLVFIWRAKRRAKKIDKDELLVIRRDPYLNFPNNNIFGGNIDKNKLEELPVFSFDTMATATNNFAFGNKLGEGGFGPVYKGKLVDGKEIAVKRLSRASGQGLEEFMNEVVVISKLQHRNLVKIIGCCIEHEEKMLIYEYMPNKSLDAVLFDPHKHELLHWRKRFEIIEGIGRGLLYLHRDSRLRIIHRDMKASNILLDEDLNPKISDFGMARIFVSNQDQANTNRVVGTYGYMSPEYAMEGRFSEKSDVFSFGVLLLEIVSGRRNTSFYNDELSQSLLRFVWKLWNEDKVTEIIDPVVSNPSFNQETMRCIHVGLLCVQEFAEDRPTMSIVLSMLTSDILDLPTPKQPAFTERPFILGIRSDRVDSKRFSINKVTVTTTVQGR